MCPWILQIPGIFYEKTNKAFFFFFFFFFSFLFKHKRKKNTFHLNPDTRVLHLCEDADFTLQGLLTAVAAANFTRTVSMEY